ncbi:MAG: FmdE family protein [Chloroflexota bacterium]
MIAKGVVGADLELERCLARASADHRRLCPRQVLGARIGQHAGVLFNIDLPQSAKRLLAIVETDGCAVDGIASATGCTVGRRTMRVLDHGKVAATFVDTRTGAAVRVWPHPEARTLAAGYAPGARDRWHAQRDGYRRMPVSELLLARPVRLTMPLPALLGQAGVRVDCAGCGEEIMNQREVQRADQVLCRACAGEAYATPLIE